jgi:L-threonylcarbamoyladenylate synthase
MIVSLEQAVELIKSGGVAAIPTETVYGLAADAFQIQAVKETFRLKGRPADNPLIVHISRLEHVEELAQNIPDEVYKLADIFWPGPLTLVLHKKNIVPDIVTGGLNTVAVRMPDHPLTRSLIDQTGPVTAPSANRSGSPSPTRARHVLEDYHGEVAVLDGGHSRIGLESTVLDLSEEAPAILRPGFVTAAMIQEKSGISVLQDSRKEKKSHRSPGTRYTHYKPKASVKWFDVLPRQLNPNIYYLLHSKTYGKSAKNFHSYHGDFSALAHDLYDHFRTADHLACSQIAIESLPENSSHPIIFALKDRIDKAICS